jgi:hypothetical protein
MPVCFVRSKTGHHIYQMKNSADTVHNATDRLIYNVRNISTYNENGAERSSPYQLLQTKLLTGD